jgi:hypothetical protein
LNIDNERRNTSAGVSLGSWGTGVSLGSWGTGVSLISFLSALHLTSLEQRNLLLKTAYSLLEPENLFTECFGGRVTRTIST